MVEFAKWSMLVQTSKSLFPHVDEWLQQNPEIKPLLLTDKPSEDFVRDHFPNFIQTYLDLAIPVEKADLFRYLAIYHLGGTYSDTDVKPLIKVEKWAETFGWKEGAQGFSLENTLLIGIEFPRQSDEERLPLQFCQWTFASTTAKHPILKAVADEVKSRARNIPFNRDAPEKTVVRRTGPIAFTSAILKYIAAHSDKGKDGYVGNYPRAMLPIKEIEKKGQFLSFKDEDMSWNLLILPYRAFGFHPWHGDDVIKEPKSQHLIHHEFLGKFVFRKKLTLND